MASWWFFVLTNDPAAVAAVQARYGPAAAESYRRAVERRTCPA